MGSGGASRTSVLAFHNKAQTRGSANGARRHAGIFGDNTCLYLSLFLPFLSFSLFLPIEAVFVQLYLFIVKRSVCCAPTMRRSALIALTAYLTAISKNLIIFINFAPITISANSIREMKMVEGIPIASAKDTSIQIFESLARRLSSLCQTPLSNDSDSSLVCRCNATPRHAWCFQTNDRATTIGLIAH